MREAGDSIDKIASALDLSWEVLERITCKFETEAVLLARSSRFMEIIRTADDPDKKWKVSFLVYALRPKVMTQNALIHHFKWAKTPEISLRDLMDVTISEQDHPKPGYLITPLLDFRVVGLKGFWSMVRQLTESDLGDRCNEEWRKRLGRLKQASRIVAGGRYSWSKPIKLPPWLLNPDITTGVLPPAWEADRISGN
jgi:hypothetical protein